ncbi:AHH domain-containing protein [Streptomyces sp. NPDC006134]|uniref:AHH domain-containing protein n=1 Tax=Streptomyces sp. NPDC006134 TaxID=3154467 RepID=UPI0033D3E244
MPRMACHFPITVTVGGDLTEARLAELERAVAEALAGRLDSARREVGAAAAGQGAATFGIRPHLPESVTFSDDPGEDRRRALEEVLLRAVAGAVARLGSAGEAPTGTPPPAPPDGSWPAAVPGDGAEGEAGRTGGLLLALVLPAGLAEEAAPPAAPPGRRPAAGRTPAPVPPASLPPPPVPPAPPGATAGAPGDPGPEQGAAVPGPEPSPPGETQEAQAPEAEPVPAKPARDEVVEGPSVFEGHVVMHLLGGRVVTVSGADRYVRATSVIRAVQLGAGVFGTRSFVVLEGPVGDPESRLWAAATTPTVSDRELRRLAEARPVRGDASLVEIGTGGGEVLGSVVDEAGRRYAVHTVVSQEGNFLTADSAATERLVRRLGTEGPKLADEEARRLVFGDLDRLVDRALAGDDDRLQEAADRLALLGEVAFSLVDWQTKTRYLRVLVQAWTLEKHERAVVAIMRTLKSVTELEAVLAVLAEHKLDEQLFRDVGDTLWSLLTTVGERFGDHRPFTVATVADLFAEAFRMPPEVREALRQSAPAGGALRLSLSVLLQIEAAAVAVADMLLGMAEGLALMVTRPAQVIEGIGRLAHLVVLFELAGHGYRPAQEECAPLVGQIGKQLVYGLEGAGLLHVGERVVTKIKWAVVVEVASWFVGFGELKAAASAVGLTEKLELVLRILAALGRTVGAAEAEVIAARMVRVAGAMRAGSEVLRGVRDDKDVLALLSHLPAEDQVRLASALERFEVAEGSTLAGLAAHPELGPAVGTSLRKAEILHTLAAKSGGLSGELGRTFQWLAGPHGFGEQDLARLAAALEDGEGPVLLAAMEHIGHGRIGPGREADMDLLTVLASKGMRMDAVREVGFDVVRAAVGRSAGDTGLLDVLLLDLGRLRNDARAQNRMAAYGELLSRLAQDDPVAWSRIAGGAALRAGGPAGAAERAAVLERIAALRARFRSGAREPAVAQRLLDGLVRRSRKDPWLVTEILDRFEAARPDRAGAYADEADLAAAWKDAERWAGHDERALLHEAGEAPPEALTPTEGMHRRLTTASRPSDELERAMAALGNPRPPGHETHHIVPEGDARAELARRILDDAGIAWRNAPENGIHLPRTSTDPRTVPEAYTRHPTLHTDAYYRELTLRLIEARHSGTVRETLAAMAEELREGRFFHVRDGATRGERFAQLLTDRKEDIDWLTDEELLEIVEAAGRTRTSRRRRPWPPE